MRFTLGLHSSASNLKRTHTDTQTHRHTDRHRHTHTQRHTETHRDTQRHTETHRDTQRHTETHRDTQRHTETHRDTQRHTETHRDTHPAGFLSALGRRCRSSRPRSSSLMATRGLRETSRRSSGTTSRAPSSCAVGRL